MQKDCTEEVFSHDANWGTEMGISLANQSATISIRNTQDSSWKPAAKTTLKCTLRSYCRCGNLRLVLTLECSCVNDRSLKEYRSATRIINIVWTLPRSKTATCHDKKSGQCVVLATPDSQGRTGRAWIVRTWRLSREEKREFSSIIRITLSQSFRISV